MRIESRTRILVVAIIVLTLLISSMALGQRRRWKRKTDINIVHQKHIAQNMACVDCHANIKGQDQVQRIYPPKSICEQCHDVENRAECGLCHLYVQHVENSVGYGDEIRPIIFSHKDHQQLMNNCEECHGEGGQLDPKVMNHQDCDLCHGDAIDGLQCALCHRTFQSIGLSGLSNFSHKDNFLADHGGFARLSSRTCTQCHKENFCTDCHNKREGVLRPSVKFPERVRPNFIHRGDWITLHRVEVGFRQEECLKCHTIRTCQSCHARSGAGPQSAMKGYQHPPGWLDINSSSFHGPTARRNIIECASCHDRGPGTNCIRCHSMPDNKPHPTGWKIPAGLERDKNSPCTYCHDSQ